MGAQTKTLSDRVDDLLSVPQSADLLSAYFDPDGTFAGRLFDDLGDNPPYAISRDDLLAVSLLDVRFRPVALRALLDSRPLVAMLCEIPVGVPLWEADDAVLYGKADPLWRSLVAIAGIGWVISGKLLARKRPDLIPIVDSVVKATIGPDESPRQDYWSGVRIAMSDPARRRRVEDLRPAGTGGVSLLRLLDVLVWMHGRNARTAQAARERAGLPREPMRPPPV